MPKMSDGYTQNFERAIERSITGLCPATAIKRILLIFQEMRRHPQICRDYLETKIYDLKTSSLEKHICPKCNAKLVFVRNRSKDSYCFYQGELEIKEYGGDYICSKCGKVYEID